MAMFWQMNMKYKKKKLKVILVCLLVWIPCGPPKKESMYRKGCCWLFQISQGSKGYIVMPVTIIVFIYPVIHFLACLSNSRLSQLSWGVTGRVHPDQVDCRGKQTTIHPQMYTVPWKGICHSDFLHISHTFLILKQNLILDQMNFSMIIDKSLDV